MSNVIKLRKDLKKAPMNLHFLDGGYEYKVQTFSDAEKGLVLWRIYRIYKAGRTKLHLTLSLPIVDAMLEAPDKTCPDCN